jgi:hypothetical protein
MALARDPSPRYRHPVDDTFIGWTTGEWQAVGTIALVLVTGVYAWLTSRLAKRAADGLRLQALPIVRARDLRPADSNLMVVYVRSIRDEPAFNVVVEVIHGDKRAIGKPLGLLDPKLEKPHPMKVMPGFNLSGFEPTTLTVTYSDAFGNRYRNAITTSPGNTSITRLDRKGWWWWRKLLAYEERTG